MKREACPLESLHPHMEGLETRVECGHSEQLREFEGWSVERRRSSLGAEGTRMAKCEQESLLWILYSLLRDHHHSQPEI